MQTSTKPYLYYEQIINGLVDVPKRIQKYLGDAIILKNEQRKAAAEQQEAKSLSLEIEPPPEDAGANNTGLFKFPLFGWLSSLTAKAPEQESDKKPDESAFNREESTLFEKEPSEKALIEEPTLFEKEPSEKDLSEKDLSEKASSEKDLSERASSESSEKTPSEESLSAKTPSEERTCNIRNWQKLKLE
jgi:hypothetical protein